MDNKKTPTDELRPEYDEALLKAGVRGKYAQRYCDKPFQRTVTFCTTATPTGSVKMPVDRSSELYRVVRGVAIVCIALGIALCLYVAFRADRQSPLDLPQMSADDVSEITVKVAKDGYSEEYDETTCGDPEAIKAFLTVVYSAEITNDHKCGSVGSITITTNSASHELRILPGHDEAYYEFRFDQQIGRVDRNAFLAALKRLGVNKVFLDSASDLKPL